MNSSKNIFVSDFAARSTLFILVFLMGIALQVNASRANLLEILIGDKIEEIAADFTNRLDGLFERRIDQVLKGLDETATETVNRGIAGGDLLVVQAGNQLRLSVEMADHLFANRIDQTIGQLDQQSQKLISVLLGMEERIRDDLSGSINIIDAIVLDLELLTQRLPLSDEEIFYIRGFRNGIFVKTDTQGGHHAVRLRGPNFGPDPAGVTTEYAFRLNGRSLGSGTSGDGDTARHDRVLRIPNRLLNSLVEDDSMRVVKLSVEINRTKEATCLLGGSCPEHSSLNAELPITLLPRRIGTMKIVQRSPTYGWKNIGPDSVSKNIGATSAFQLIASPSYTGGEPKLGARRIKKDSVSVACQASYKSVRTLNTPNNDGKPIDANDPIFTSGWTGKRAMIGKPSKDGNVDGPGTHTLTWNEVVRQLKSKLGDRAMIVGGPFYNLISKKVWETGPRVGWKAHNYPRDIVITAAEFWAISSAPYNVETTGCTSQQSSAPQFSNGDSTVTVSVQSSTDVNTPWVLTAEILEYQEIDIESVEKEVPVYFDEIIEFDVRNADVSDIRFRFESEILGRNQSFSQTSLGSGFSDAGQGSIGSSITVLRYLFSLPELQ